MNSQSIVTGLSIVVATIFATLYLANPRVKETQVDKIVRVEVPVTNEVIKEVQKTITVTVTNVVEKRIEVNAPVPPAYLQAHQIVSDLVAATNITQQQCLQSIPSFSVKVYFSKEVFDLVPEQSVRTKFELTLRKSGIRIAEDSRYTLIMSVEGFQSDNLIVYNYATTLLEDLYLFREAKVMMTPATVYRISAYGTVGKSNFKESALKSTESLAEEFANTYLTANQKPVH
ncbi:MAG: hypothetical protein IT581_04895 [Verrucomicrobiales bacterium]|nr:hypothetical protein [Verrucomicrobiales bacterium]